MSWINDYIEGNLRRGLAGYCWDGLDGGSCSGCAYKHSYPPSWGQEQRTAHQASVRLQQQLEEEAYDRSFDEDDEPSDGGDICDYYNSTEYLDAAFEWVKNHDQEEEEEEEYHDGEEDEVEEEEEGDYEEDDHDEEEEEEEEEEEDRPSRALKTAATTTTGVAATTAADLCGVRNKRQRNSLEEDQPLSRESKRQEL